MADFDDLKDKKYPESITDEEVIPETVIREEANPELDPRRFLMVYAGPGYFNAQKENPFGGMNAMMSAAGKAETEPVTEDVYAGPGMMGEPGCEEPCEEAPAEEAEESEAADSDSSEQSGAQSADGEVSEPAPEKPEEKRDSRGRRIPYDIYNDPRMMAAYAGPVFPDPAAEAFKKSMMAQAPMMFVYAAPPLPRPNMQSAPSEGTEQKFPKFCTMCGAELIPGAKFCAECGYKVQYPDGGGVQNC